MSLVIVGYTVEPAPGAEDTVTKPPVPKSYTGAAAATWLERAMEEIRFDLSFSKITGRIASVYAVAPEHKAIFSRVREKPDQTVGGEFIDWLLGLYPNGFSKTPAFNHMEDAQEVFLFGFGASTFCRVCGVEASLNKRVVPCGFWHGNRTAFDPYDMLTESDQRKWLKWSAVCLASGIQVPVDWQPHQDAQVDARLAAELVFRHNLYVAEELAATVAKLQDPQIEQPERDEEPAAAEPESEPAPAPARRSVSRGARRTPRTARPEA